MNRCLFFFCLLLHTLAAEEEQDFSLVNLTKSPIPRVAGTVNIVTGNWVDQATHAETSGPDPYIVAHSYISSSLEEGSLADGWDLYHPSTLEVFQPQGITYIQKGVLELPPATSDELIAKSHYTHLKPQKPCRPHQDGKPERYPLHPENNEARLFFREAGGGVYHFNGDSNAQHFHPVINKTGYSHTSSIDHPSRRDLRRTKVQWNRAHDEWIVTLGDGTQRVYARTNKQRRRPGYSQSDFSKSSYHIKEEVFPSGNRRWYHYDSDKELKLIQTVSSNGKRVLHYVQFHRHHDSVEVKTSEGFSTRFSLKKLHDHGTAQVVEAIDRDSKGKLSFSYCDKSPRHTRRIYEKRCANGRRDTAKFYHEGRNEVGKSVIHISDKKEKKFLENRVREIWTKSLSGLPTVLSHEFTYRDWKTHGKAEVRESDGAVSAYIWDTEHRPTWIGKDSSEGRRLSSEHYVWGKGRDEGRLLRRTHFDENGDPLLDHAYEFDTAGNVISESLRGLFSGRPSQKLLLDGHKHIHGGETLSWKAAYTSDGRHLKKAERDPSGNWTYLEYDTTRCLLTARFTCDQDRIIKREFFTYDSAAVCIKSMVDDGSSRDKNDLKDVTRRTIHRVQPRQKTPYFGAPDEEKWSVWTPQCGEQLLKTERYTRDTYGRAVRKELLDGCGVVQKEWVYAYDRFHRVVMTCDPTGRVEKFDYDNEGHIVTHTTPAVTTTFTYDLFERVIEEKKTFLDGTTESLCHQYDLSGRSSSQIDARGRTTTKVRDLCGRLIKTLSPAMATEQGIVRPESRIEYSGSLERHISPTGAVTTLTRSAAGKPLVTTTPSGATTYCNYDARNRLVEQCDPSGMITLYEYDAFDRPTKVEQRFDGKSLSVITKRYQGFDLVEERHPTKAIFYRYDTLGRTVEERVTDLLTDQSTTSGTCYDSLHRVIRVEHKELGTHELLTYDRADRVTERRVVGSDGSLISVTTTAYDGAGRVVEEGVGRAGTIARTTTSYGAYGLPSSITHPDGTVTSFSYNPLYRWTDGHLYFQKVTTDARGVVSEELLDAHDQVRSKIVTDPFGTVISNRTVTFSILGKPVVIEDHEIASGQDRSTVRTCLKYDTVGQMISCTLGDGTPEAASWWYSYDAEGRKIQEIKPSGTTLTSSYDPKGRLVSFTSSDGTIAWRYDYNIQDLPETVTNEVSGAVTHRLYNGLGMMVEEGLENGTSLVFDLLPSGQLSSITYPDGSHASYEYFCGQLSSVKRRGYEYRVVSRDLSGMITSATLPGLAGQIVQSMDIMGRKTSVIHPAFQEERTAFDPVGCCLERTIDGRNEVFSYDFLCQLTSDDGRSARYDSLYRRVETEGTKACHNARHQILSQGERAFEYDVDGRRTDDDRYTYRYDGCDRLIAVEDATTRYEYTYDPFNRRLSSSKYTMEEGSWKKEAEERFIWHGDCEIGSVDEASRMKTLRTLGEGLGGEIGAAVCCEVDGELFVPIHDCSGHVRACVNMSGEVVEKLSYTAFGVESRTAQITPWTFSSKRQDQETEFLYFGRRFYESSTATWLTQDPLGTSAGPNLYAYVKNNPLTYCDLFGLEGAPTDDRGFFGSVWDTVCDFFGTAFDGNRISESLESAAFQGGACLEAPIFGENADKGELAQNLASGSVAGIAEGLGELLDGLSEGAGGSPVHNVAGMSGGQQSQDSAGSTLRGLAEKNLPGDPNNISYQNARQTMSIVIGILSLLDGNLGGLRGIPAGAGRLSSYAVKSIKSGSFATQSQIRASPARINHILAGRITQNNKYSGGHRWPGLPGKTSFPKGWDSEKIMFNISSVANDPALPKEIVKGGMVERVALVGERDGIRIKVIIEPTGEGIITGYPTS